MNYNQDRTGFDPTTNTYHEQYDWGEDESFTVAVVTAVAEVTGDAPADVEPLYDTIDVDALETLLYSLREGDSPSAGCVEFEYNGRTVAVDTTGEICVQCDPQDPLTPE